MTLPFPQIHPVAFSIGPFKIHWYALAYVVGILLSCSYAKFLMKRYPNGIDPDHVDRFAYGPAILGVIVGGRLGHVLFYDPLHYLHHPFEIIMTWKGGMSFHGGLLGFLGAALWYARHHHIAFFKFMDLAAISVPLAIGLGRIANFINGELFGLPTSLPWGVIFPHGGGVPRHPTQLYEAFTEGFLIWGVLTYVWIKGQSRNKEPLRLHAGAMGGAFLFLYGTLRFAIEFVKDPSAQSSIVIGGLNNGHLLCIPMILVGALIYHKAQRGNL